MISPVDFEYIAKLIYDAYKVPVLFVNATQSITVDYMFTNREKHCEQKLRTPPPMLVQLEAAL